MLISEAKEIPISLLAERLGAVFKWRRGQETWWLSPFRDEKTPSFKVNEKTNKFCDFGDTRGQGDILDLWIDYHNRNRKDKEAIKEALTALEDFGTIQQKFLAAKEEVEVKYSERYRIKKWSKRIKSDGLSQEVKKRNLPLKLVDMYMSEVLVEDTETKYVFNAFAMMNDVEGVELAAYYPSKEKPFDKFKNCLGPKGIRTYPADASEKDVTALAFSSKWDFVTWMYLKSQQPDEEIILYNGDSLVNECANYILSRPNIKKIIHFKHMDASGERADAALAEKLEPTPILYGSVEHLYSGYKDLSDGFSDNSQSIRAALKIDSVQKTFYEPVVKPQGTPKYGL